MDQLIEINSLEEYEKAIQTKSIILFTASWCPDCMFIKPFIGNVVKKYPNFTFYSINRDHFIDLCQDLDILGIPSFVSYENGQETGRFVSKLRKTQEEIETFKLDVKVKGKSTKKGATQEENSQEATPKLNFVISSYYKGTGLEEILKKLEEYLDNADKAESDITNI